MKFVPARTPVLGAEKMFERDGVTVFSSALHKQQFTSANDTIHESDDGPVVFFILSDLDPTTEEQVKRVIERSFCADCSVSDTEWLDELDVLVCMNSGLVAGSLDAPPV